MTSCRPLAQCPQGELFKSARIEGFHMMQVAHLARAGLLLQQLQAGEVTSAGEVQQVAVVKQCHQSQITSV